MNSFDHFKVWLDDNYAYTKATKSDIVSRLRRADKILPIISDPVYLFKLSQCNQFSNLSVNVKSQIRRAVKIYLEFTENEDAKAND